jgi:hypothetical protein
VRSSAFSFCEVYFALTSIRPFFSRPYILCVMSLVYPSAIRLAEPSGSRAPLPLVFPSRIVVHPISFSAGYAPPPTPLVLSSPSVQLVFPQSEMPPRITVGGLSEAVLPLSPKRQRRRASFVPVVAPVLDSMRFPPEWGPKLRAFASSAPFGSFESSSLFRDAAEGLTFAVFVRDRPSWPRLTSGFRLAQQLDDDAAHFAAQHHVMLALGRRSVLRYEEWFYANVHLMISPDPYHIVSGDVLAALVRAIAAASAQARGESDADAPALRF